MNNEGLDITLDYILEPNDLASECCGAKVEVKPHIYNDSESYVCTKCNKQCDWSLDSE